MNQSSSPQRSKPTAPLFLNLKKKPGFVPSSINIDDHLPPGTLSKKQQEEMNSILPLSLKKFDLQGGGFVHSSHTHLASQQNLPKFYQNNSRNKFSTSSKLTAENFYKTFTHEKVGLLKFDHDKEPIEFIASDLEDQGEIGRGAFGSVNKMIHKSTLTKMAVKRIRTTVDEQEQNKLLMDLDVVMRSSDCPYIVKFYGAVFWEGDCWICMELMSTSLDKFYRFVYNKMNDRIPEDILGKIAQATVKALDYLKESLQIIHRDVKPSNILIDRKGNIKLCDFSISGQLVNSIAKTRDVGCRPYMAPERIEPSQTSYDVTSDVWSLGISLIELATGKFPYPKWKSVFDQLTQVVNGQPPKIRCNYSEKLTFSQNFVDFINMMTISQSKLRPKYDKLLQSSYLRGFESTYVPVSTYFCSVLDQMNPSDLFGNDDCLH